MPNVKERLLTVIKGEVPDQVPVVIHWLNPFAEEYSDDPAWNSFLKYVRKKSDVMAFCGIEPFLFHTRAAEVQLVEKFTSENGYPMVKDKITTPRGDLYCTSQSIPGGAQCEHWIETLEDIEKILSLSYIPLQPAEVVQRYRSLTKELGDRALVIFWGGGANRMLSNNANKNSLLPWLIEERDILRKFIHTMQERIMDTLDYLTREEPEAIYHFGGPEHALPPLMSPQDFDEFVVKPYREMSDLIHSRGGTFGIHCHGRVNDFMDKFVQIGTDLLDPLEPPPLGDVNLAEVKSKFGDKMCLIGNIQACELERLSREEIDLQVKERIQAAAEGGGYIVSPTASPWPSPATTPEILEKYKQIIASTRKYGVYR